MERQDDLSFLARFDDPHKIIHEGNSDRPFCYTPIIHHPLLVEVGLMESARKYWISPHKHNAMTEILFVEDGTGKIAIEGRYFPVQAGDMVIYHPEQTHSEFFVTENGKIKVYHLRISSFQIKDLKSNYLIPDAVGQIHRVLPQNMLIYSCFDILFEESSKQQIGHEQIIYKRLEILLLQILDLYAEHFPQKIFDKKSWEQIAIYTKSYLDDHYQQNQGVHLENVSKVLSVSKYYISHCFAAYYGLPPMQYLKLRRMDEAKRLLYASNHSISEIANDVGYNNVSGFISQFRSQTGMSPAQYRAVTKSTGERNSTWSMHIL